jgi:hypothetical protein
MKEKREMKIGTNIGLGPSSFQGWSDDGVSIENDAANQKLSCLGIPS